jgi:hypothetical protein
MPEPGPTAHRIQTFEEFWPFYVRDHGKRATRIFHFIGTTVGFLFLARAVTTERPLLLICGLVASYGFAWMGHFLIERNNPATFQHPLWSLLGDLKMYGLMWSGKMTAEAARLAAAAPRGAVLDGPGP